MQYMLLIYGNESANLSQEEMDRMMPDYFAFTTMLQEKGKMIAGEALHPTATATTVRVRDGKTVTTDGPFAETKEQLGGFYFVNADSMDEALAYAAQIPGAKDGCVEVREVMVFEQP